MNSQIKAHLAQKIDGLKADLKHAFALGSPDKPLTAEETALLEKVAATIVSRRMSGPALLFLESAGPMNFLGSQALHFLAPILDLACDAREVELAAHLLERRDAISRLIAMIDALSTPGTAAPQ
ncbi:MAG: hypothetical protein KGN30_08665 [Nitrospirota bacterium]|nr:hypothetical protein [Nitrospirota bacterium]